MLQILILHIFAASRLVIFLNLSLIILSPFPNLHVWHWLILICPTSSCPSAT